MQNCSTFLYFDKPNVSKLDLPAETGGLGRFRIRLLELVDTERSPDITAVTSSLLAEARAVSGVLQGEVLRQQPLVGVVDRDGLLRGRDEVLVGLSVHNLVKLYLNVSPYRLLFWYLDKRKSKHTHTLVKLLQLGRLGHLILEEEEWRLEGRETLVGQELDAVVDDGLVQEDAPKQ